jgi:Fe-S cluster assembly protein SufD
MTTVDSPIKPVKNAEILIKSSYSREDIPVSRHAGMDALRLRAWEAFNTLSLPSRKDDTWKRVDFSRFPLDQLGALHPTGAQDRPGDGIENLESILSQGVYAGTIRGALERYPEVFEKAFNELLDPKQDLFAALPAAFSEGGFFLYIPEGLHVTEPIRIKFKPENGKDVLFNNLVWLEPGSQARIVLDESRPDGKNKAELRIGNLGIHVGRNANLTFIDSQAAESRTWKIAHDRAVLEAESQLEWLVLATEGVFTKHFVQVDLGGQGAVVKMAGLYLTSGSQQVEFNTRQNHLAPDTKSNLLYKGVLLDESRSLFSGMIHVSPGAIKTDGYQANRNLIIGSGAHADSLPGLEILTDDVRCTHGATVGKVDPTEMFYLQSRGFNERDAQRVIIQGFLDPIIQMLPDEAERLLMQKQIELKIG